MQRRISCASVVVGALLGALVADADAGANAVCADIKKGDVAACSKAAAAKCDSIASYWDKVHCVEAVVAEFDGCQKDNVYRKACEPRIADYWEICRKAGELDVNKDESIDAWKRRLLAYDQAVAAFEAFDGEWKVCYDSTGPATGETCQRPQDKLRECKEARAEYAKTFAEAVDFFLQTGFEQGKQRIADEMARKDYPAAMQWAEYTTKRVELFARLNAELPDFAHRAKDIDGARADLKSHRAKAAKAYDKVIARNRCPRGKRNDKKVVAALRPAVDGFFHSTDDQQVAVKVFRLNGKKTTTSDRKLRQTSEEIPAIACTQKTRADETMCQSFNITLRRIKPDGGSWGDWRVFVGSSERLLCKNVK